MKKQIFYSGLLLFFLTGCVGTTNETVSIPQRADKDIEKTKREFIAYLENKFSEIEAYQNKLYGYDDSSLDCNSTDFKINNEMIESLMLYYNDENKE